MRIIYVEHKYTIRGRLKAKARKDCFAFICGGENAAKNSVTPD